MRLLPESNGLYKVKKRRSLNKWDILKRVSLAVIFIFGVGFIFQLISNFIGNEKARPRLGYGRVDGSKLEYKTKGSGKYSIIFDGAIGTNLYGWDSVVKKIDKSFDATTFTYNRRGYGFSDNGNRRTPEEQAEDLRNLLKKAGVYPPYILVGEEYGSLVLTNFAKKYKDEVAGIVLLNPIEEAQLKNIDYRKILKGAYYRSRIEYLGSYVGLTALMDKFNLILKNERFEEALAEGPKEEFDIHKTKKSYRQAIKNEITNLYKGENSGPEDGAFSDIPLYIISNKEDSTLRSLGGEYTTFYKTECKDSLLSIYDTDNVVKGVEKVLRDIKKIEAMKSN